MAYIGLYGVYVGSCTHNAAGEWDGQYGSGCTKLGKAIAASFTPANGGENNLYADNAIAESASVAPAGGTLSITLDRLTDEGIMALWNISKTTESVTVNSTNVNGVGFNFTGSETPWDVGVGFIRQKQLDNNRNHYEAIVFGCCTFKWPSDDAQTLGDSVEWQTPTLEATVQTGASGTNWMKRFEFPTQEAAIEWIETLLSD